MPSANRASARWLVLFLLTSLLAPAVASAQASFEALPFFRLPFTTPPFDPPSNAFLQLSGDGQTVSGSYAPVGPVVPVPTIAARFDVGAGLTDLELLPTTDPLQTSINYALGTSADGTTIVGESRLEPVGPRQAIVWDASGALTNIGSGLLGGESRAVDVSADGSVVVGQDNPSGGFGPSLGGFVWDPTNGARSIGALAGVSGTLEAAAISDDGTTVAGFVGDPIGPTEAFRWTEAGGLQELGLGAPGLSSEAFALSADGSTVAGAFSLGAAGAFEAFRWTEATGIEGLGQVEYEVPGGIVPPQTSFQTLAYGASADGSVIVGGGDVAWIYSDALGGMVSLRELLIQLGVVGLDQVELSEAVDVSADGKVITGFGFDPARVGGTIAWRAVIPEPSTAVLVGLGLAGLARRRRR